MVQQCTIQRPQMSHRVPVRHRIERAAAYRLYLCVQVSPTHRCVMYHRRRTHPTSSPTTLHMTGPPLVSSYLLQAGNIPILAAHSVAMFTSTV